MSGICGIINLDNRPVPRQSVETLLAHLTYRGPDAQDIWLDGNVGFGHTLLRTTWESAGEQQPCTLDGQVYITAQARIDDRATLIPRLQAQGCLVSASDPDVNLILHAYQLWGETCLESLLGDFVFALWDRRHRKLFCARDRFGLRVIYYARLGNTLVFSNSLNCVRAIQE
ncbi:MAG: hypothetical protein HC890_00650 [Chloroflexaceae bacterium]|nr:hypothetical protein [Chloroflexaceae bacterium]